MDKNKKLESIIFTNTAWKMSVFGVFLVRIQSECGKIRTRKTPITGTFTNLSYYGYFQKIWNHTFTEDTWKFLNSIKISNILLKLSLRYPENLCYFSFWNVSLASLNVKSSFLITCEPEQYIIVMKQLYLQIIIAKFWKIYKIPFIWLRETCSWRVEWNFYGCL